MMTDHALACREVKAWKKAHALGLIPNVLSDLLKEEKPSEACAARERDEAHDVIELMDSFIEKDSINRKGIKVAVLDKGLWVQRSSATEEMRKDLLKKVEPFSQAAYEMRARRAYR